MDGKNPGDESGKPIEVHGKVNEERGQLGEEQVTDVEESAHQVEAHGKESERTGQGVEVLESLPPPPPVIPKNVVPITAVPVAAPAPKSSQPKRLPASRPGLGKQGRPIALLSNYFKAEMSNMDDYFYQYSITLKYEDGSPVLGIGMGRRVLDKTVEVYHDMLGNKDMAYDGEKCLFTVGSLPQVYNRFTVHMEHMLSAKVLESGDLSPGKDDHDRKRRRLPYRMKRFDIEIIYASKVPIRSMMNAIRGFENEKSQEAIRVLDLVLRQHAAKQGCLLVRQSFFSNEPRNYSDVGGGVLACKGFHSSFRATQSGLSLNIDSSTTMIVKPGLVTDFLLMNQNVRNVNEIDWNKARRSLKGLLVNTVTTNLECKVVGLSALPCSQTVFTLKRRKADPAEGEDPVESMEITVFDYFTKIRKVHLFDSAHLPCVNVGKLKRPTYYPMEMCTILPLQRYKRSLSTFQRSSLVEKSRQKPRERMEIITGALRNTSYNTDPIFQKCGLTISSDFLQLGGRVLPPPRIKAGKGEELMPRNGRWNFNNKTLKTPANVTKWAIIIFSARCDVKLLIREIRRCGQMKGMNIDEPKVVEEDPSASRLPPQARVDKMVAKMKSSLPSPPNFILCILRDRKNSEIYGPWKCATLVKLGIVNQCLAAPNRINDQFVTNLLLKINTKMDGVNSLLQGEEIPRNIPPSQQAATFIMGMDVSHGPPGQNYIPSIAAVVGSLRWPCLSRYRAEVRSQASKEELIEGLFLPTADGSDDKGTFRSLVKQFYQTSNRKPERVIIFRDGVSESQFSQVLNVELDQIIQAAKHLDGAWPFKFTVVVAQKNHHTKFFPRDGSDNVPAGTVVDNGVCHPRNFDFYMCAHAGMIGTTRPTHYHVIYDENGFTADSMQELVHSLSYVYQRSTTAIAQVAPIYYAHLAASQVGQFVKFEEHASDTNSSKPGAGAADVADASAGSDISAAPASRVKKLPTLHHKIENTMFFC